MDEPNPSIHKLIQSITSLHNDLSIFTNHCNLQFQSIDSKIQNIHSQNDAIMSFVNKINNCGLQSPIMNMAPNFSKIDNKEEYLNINVTNVIQNDLFAYLKEQASKYITKQHVYDVLNSSYDVFEFVSNIIHLIESEGELRSLYSFPFQKSVIYFWNIHKKTWEKVNMEILRKLFNVIQYELVICYNILIQSLKESNTFELKSVEFMEKSNLIFCDDFDKKYKQFKKSLFDKLCNA